MLNRYTKEPMDRVWTEQAKYDQWVQSLLAVLSARVLKGQINQSTYDLIAQSVKVDVERVRILDKEFQHDAQALIETARESLISAGIDEATSAILGARITSYDMEDPAFCSIIIRAMDLILPEIEKLILELKKRRKILPMEPRSNPETYILPEWKRSIPMMFFIRVVFPTPLRPMTHVTLFGSAIMLTSLRVFTSPYEKDIRSSLSMVPHRPR